MNSILKLFQSEDDRQQFLSGFSDPFQKESIRSISMWIWKNIHNDTVTFSATVKFQRGNTTGEHEIKAPDFVALVNQVEHFVKEL